MANHKQWRALTPVLQACSVHVSTLDRSSVFGGGNRDDLIRALKCGLESHTVESLREAGTERVKRLLWRKLLHTLMAKKTSGSDLDPSGSDPLSFEDCREFVPMLPLFESWSDGETALQPSS